MSRLATRLSTARLLGAVAAIAVWGAVGSGCGGGEDAEPIPGQTGRETSSPDGVEVEWNPIPRENARPGNPPSEWDIENTDEPSIEGFASQLSVRPGDTVRFKVKSETPSFRFDVYRMGFYGGLGARRVDAAGPRPSQVQPLCGFEAETGRVHCENWADTASWTVPDDAVSGIYFAKLVPLPEGRANHVFWVVRERTARSDLLFQTSDTTWQAYNRWGDRPERELSYYAGPPGADPPQARSVSYDRPFRIGAVVEGERQHFRDGWHGVFAAEYPMVRFLERNGYDVSYASGADTDRFPEALLGHRVFLSVGHDEYWSGGQRRNVERARDAGVHLAFFSGGEMLWKTRWKDDHRTLVCYKEPFAGRSDPAAEWTGQWRDRRGADAGLPENAVTGTLGWQIDNAALRVAAVFGRLRFWRGTALAELPKGEVATSSANVIGYEWDEDADNGFRPAGLVRLSRSRIGSRMHSVVMHRRADSGALVFGAGTVQWSWALDGPDAPHRYAPDGDSGSPPDRNLQQATVNLFADMGVQPATLQDDLERARASDDTGPPIVSIAPPEGDVLANRPVVLRGSATDGSGRVAGMEVAIGDRWHRAEGWERWRYEWTPAAPGPVEVRARAVDDSGNIATTPPLTIEVRDPATGG